MKKDTALEEIVTLIENKMGRYRKAISRSTSLENDLGITGGDAIELIIEYSKMFNVDISGFRVNDYFEGEGMDMDIIGPIIRFFTKKGNKSIPKKELLVEDLIQGIEVGRLE